MSHRLSPTVSQVLGILNDGQIHAGSDIAEALGLSRTAVWKIVHRLKKYHVDISTKHQGYQLKSPLILLDQKKIESFLKNPAITLDLYEHLPSTSEYIQYKVPLKPRIFSWRSKSCGKRLTTRHFFN